MARKLTEMAVLMIVCAAVIVTVIAVASHSSAFAAAGLPVAQDLTLQQTWP